MKELWVLNISQLVICESPPVSCTFVPLFAVPNPLLLAATVANSTITLTLFLQEQTAGPEDPNTGPVQPLWHHHLCRRTPAALRIITTTNPLSRLVFTDSPGERSSPSTSIGGTCLPTFQHAVCLPLFASTCINIFVLSNHTVQVTLYVWMSISRQEQPLFSFPQHVYRWWFLSGRCTRLAKHVFIAWIDTYHVVSQGVLFFHSGLSRRGRISQREYNGGCSAHHNHVMVFLYHTPYINFSHCWSTVWLIGLLDR